MFRFYFYKINICFVNFLFTLFFHKNKIYGYNLQNCTFLYTGIPIPALSIYPNPGVGKIVKIPGFLTRIKNFKYPNKINNSLIKFKVLSNKDINLSL